MAIFRSGQLVSLHGWCTEPVDLFSVPTGTEDVRVIGRLMKKDVALVIAPDRGNGESVYVICPGGGGWTFGAFLRILKEATG